MENQDSDDELHRSKRAKFSLISNEEKINCAPDDIFDEKQYIEQKKTIYSSRQINRVSELWSNFEKLQQNLTKIHCKETHKTRLYKLPIYSEENHIDSLMYLLRRLSIKIEDNLEHHRRISLEEVRTITPADLSYIEPHEDSNDDEIDVVGISDSELLGLPTDENSAGNQLYVSINTSNTYINTPVAPVRDLSRAKSVYALKVINRRTWKNVELDENSILQLVPTSRAIYSDTGIKRQNFMKQIIDKTINLLQTNSYATKRDLFYIFQSWCKCITRRQTTSNDVPQTTQTQDVNPNPEDAPDLPETPPQSASLRVGTQPPESQMTGTQQGEQSKTNERYNPGILDEVIDDLCCLVGCSKIHLNILVQSKCIVYGNLNFELSTGK